MLHEMLNDLKKWKENEQFFYKCTGETEEDKLLNKVIQDTWDNAISIVKHYMERCDHDWKFVSMSDDIRVKVYCPKCDTIQIMLKWDWDEFCKVRKIKKSYNQLEVINREF